MDDFPICPDWWPRTLWELHFRQVPWDRQILVNYPPPVESILASLLAHTSSYLLEDQKVGAEIRKAAVTGIIESANKLSVLRDKLPARNAK